MFINNRFVATTMFKPQDDLGLTAPSPLAVALEELHQRRHEALGSLRRWRAREVQVPDLADLPGLMGDIAISLSISHERHHF